MDKLKSIVRRLAYPHPAILIPLSIISFGGVIAAMVILGDSHIISYVTYALSAYSLTAICLRIPDFVKFCRHLREDNQYISRWFSDEKLRVRVSLITSLFMCGAFGAFQLGLALRHSSVWYYSLAAYYAILTVMRAFLLRDMRVIGEDGGLKKELSRYRSVGITLMAMGITLAGISLYIVEFGYGMKHHFITTIALAAFTFYSLTMAIINVIRYRRYNSPLLSAAKAVGLVSAAVSMLTLETAMLSAFGSADGEDFRSIMTAATSAAVLIFTLTVSVYMIRRYIKETKRMAEADGQQQPR